MVAFNVTTIQPPGYVHAAALTEAADYVAASLRECTFTAVRTKNSIVREAVNIIFCSHILSAEAAGRIPRDAIIFNSERLVGETDWPIQNPVYKTLLYEHYVWDYSINNLACVPHENKSVIQFGYSEALRRRDIERRPSDSLLFYGAVTPWRRQLLDALQRRGVNIRVLFGVYGDARDREMHRAWAVLNLHKAPGENLFEPIRCFYPLINQVPVISESVDDPSAHNFLDSVVFLNAGELADRIVYLRGQNETFQSMSTRMLERFRSKSGHEVLRTAVERYLRWTAART